MKPHSLPTTLIITLLAIYGCVYGQSSDVSLNDEARREDNGDVVKNLIIDKIDEDLANEDPQEIDDNKLNQAVDVAVGEVLDDLSKAKQADSRQIRRETDDTLEQRHARETTDEAESALKRRGWLSDTWESAKSKLKKIGGEIDEGVEKFEDKVKEPINKIINLKPGESYSYEFRDTDSPNAIEKRAFNPHKYEPDSGYWKIGDVTKRKTLPYYHWHDYKIKRNSDAAKENRDSESTLRKRGWFSDTWDYAKSKLKKVGDEIDEGVEELENKIEDGVKKIKDKLHDGDYHTVKVIKLKPGETYTYVYRNADSEGEQKDPVARSHFVDPYDNGIDGWNKPNHKGIVYRDQESQEQLDEE